MNNKMIDLIDDDSIAVVKQMIPRDPLQPALFIAKVKGFPNLDKYIISLIEDDLISVREGGQGSDFSNKIAEYLDGIKYLNKIYNSDLKEESERDYVKVKLDSDLVDRFNKLEERKQQDQEKEDLK